MSRLSIEVFKYPGGAAGTPVNLCTWHLGEAAPLLPSRVHIKSRTEDRRQRRARFVKES